MSVRVPVLGLIAACLIVGPSAPASAQGVTIEQILKYRPRHKEVEVETPEAADQAKCKVEVERSGKGSGWVVYGPQGQMIRRFMDTDGDNVVDQWRYFLNGLEVYRDLDTNANNEVDQSRWFNTAGSRWGIDENEDGKIDRWKMISAEEASREAIKAMAAGDAAALGAVLLTEADSKALGLKGEAATSLLDSVKGHDQKLRATLRGSKTILPATKWVRFDSSMLMPSLIPVDMGVSSQELFVYENVMAIVDTGGKTGFVQIGEMVRVGDTWKLTRVPQPLEGESPQVAEAASLMRPAMTAVGVPAGATGLTPEVQAIIDQLRKLDEAAPRPDAAKTELIAYNTGRAGLLQKLSEVSTTQEERDLWLRQRIDGVAAGVQMDAYPNGIEELKKVEAEARKGGANSPLVPYAYYRRMMAEANLQMQQAEAAERAEIQTKWMKSLEEFITAYPGSEDTADAMLQLAQTSEFNGKLTDAKSWYERLAGLKREAPATAIAAGALRRLNLKGSALRLAGPALAGGGAIDIARYRGKVVAVLFWATWCRPCTEDLPQMIELYKQHQSQGFEVLGINLDSDGAPIQQYIQQHKVPWPHIHEQGGLQSPIAQQFGIITLPTTFLVDRDGKVASSGASVDDLKKLVPELVMKK